MSNEWVDVCITILILVIKTDSGLSFGWLEGKVPFLRPLLTEGAGCSGCIVVPGMSSAWR